MNLTSLLVERARQHPERLALVDSCGEVSYGELARRVSAGARGLHEMGLSRGQVILVFQPVSIALYELLLAAFHAGLRAMLADPSAGRNFLGNCCKRLKPDAFFGSWKAQLLRMTVAEMREIDLPICSGRWFPGARKWQTNGFGIAPVETDNDEPALITFTSGSTGLPKAAVRSHGFLLAQHQALSKSLDFEEGEVDLITLPVFVLANLASGLTSVLAATDLAKPGTPDVAAITRQCIKYHVTRSAASPAFFEGLLAGGIPNFKKLYTGGAPVFPDLLRRLTAALPDARIESVYGSTEAEPIAHFSAEQASDDTDSLTQRGGGICTGQLVPEIKLRIVTDHWGTPLGPLNEADFFRLLVTEGQAGEIIVSGDHVLRGYLNGIGDEETKIHVEDQIWHRTGDAGWIDPQGRVWLLGRCAEKLPEFAAHEGLPMDVLRYPLAIECALREIFPHIRMAAIEWEKRRTLIVQGVESESIYAKAQQLGMQRIIYLKSIPMDRRHNAKIDYPALRGILQNQTIIS